MLRGGVTAALGFITMNSFFHFHHVPGPASAMLLPSWFSSHLQLQEQNTLLQKISRVQIPSFTSSWLHDPGMVISVLEFSGSSNDKMAPEYLGLGWEIDTSPFSPPLYIPKGKGQGISKFLGLIDNLTRD